MRGFASLVRLLRKTDSVLIIGHQNSDPDAVCSAYAFSVLIHRINRKSHTTIASPEGVSKMSKQILSTAVPVVIDEHPDISKFELIVTVDTNTLQQLGQFRDSVQNSTKPVIMIDHHAPHPENAKIATLVLCNQNTTSTCEMILEMYTKLHMMPDRKVCQALLIGILIETGHMSIANRKTFAAAHTLVKAGANPETALALARTTMDDSERIARIKSAQRLRLEKIDRWLIALSEVGSYHASAARGLIALGAHLAIVAGKRNDDLTISLRCTREFTDETKIHLGTDL
ncbi:MAG TPA: DHH family phosphoesterase, partial [Candidatus Bathyarchaeia archaeon]|nr:DHH family phosphoesterase [Candidatus Bathyarchaeia archaeon]